MRIALKRPAFIQLAVVAVGDQSALAGVGWRLLDQRGSQAIADFRERLDQISQALMMLRDRRPLTQKRSQRLAVASAASKRDQIARAGASDRQAGGNSRHVVDVIERVSQLFEKPTVIDKRLHHALAFLNRRPVAARITKPLAQQPLAHRRYTML